MDAMQQALAQGHAEQAAEYFLKALSEAPDRLEETAQAAGAALAAEYNRLSVRPVLQFAQIIRRSAPPAIVEAALLELKPLAERTHHWAEEIRGVTRERLAREARAAITLEDLKLAVRRGQALIGLAKDDKDAAQLAKYFIDAVGGLHRDQDRSWKVVQSLVNAGTISAAMGFDWIAAFKDATDRAAKAGFETSDREWTLTLNAASGSMLEFLPFRREAGEPTIEQMRKFSDELLAVLRAGTFSGNDDDLIDALMIVKEFCPTDPPLIQSLVGVEPRLFLELGPRAKLVAVRALAQAGQVETLRDRIIQFAESEEAEARGEAIAAVMGGLRHADFFPALQKFYHAAKPGRQQDAIVEAIGRIGSPDGLTLLLEELEKSLKKARQGADVKLAKKFLMMEQADTGAETKRARSLLTSLGRLARLGHLDAPRRRAVISKVIELVGESDLTLAQHAAAQMFAGKMEEIDRDSRSWAARQLTRALFSPDHGEAVGEGAASPLGFRQSLVLALSRLGREMFPEILQVAEPFATRFSPALLAFAELVQKSGNESAAPLLETMISTAFMHSPDAKGESYIMREKVRDAATGEMRELDKDEVVHSLLFALEKVGGAKGQQMILEFADRVQAGQLTSPGGETSSFLLAAKRKHGSVGKIGAAAPLPSEEDFPEDEVRRAMGLAKGGLFSNAQKQIAGLNFLGRAKRTESLPVIVGCLGAKDSLVQAAAETALTAFMIPLPDPKRFERILMDLFGDPKAIRGDALDRLVRVVERSFPKRPPFDGLFHKYVGTELTDGAAAHRLKSALLVVEAFTEPAAPATDGGTGGAPGEPGDAPSIPRPAPARPGQPEKTQLDLKREYMLARQAWIKGGKQGPAPEPPE